MKQSLLITLSVLAATFIIGGSIADDDAGKKASAEKAITKLEQEWAEALVKGDQAVIDRVCASDWLLTDPSGAIQTKAQADASLKSGAIKFESFKSDELKIRVFGDAAVVHGLETEKSRVNGNDTSGQYRFTDVFVKRDGRWQAVATHVSLVQKQ